MSGVQTTFALALRPLLKSLRAQNASPFLVAILLGSLFLASCSGPEPRDASRQPGPDVGLQDDLDRQKSSTGRRMRGEDEPPPSSPAQESGQESGEAPETRELTPPDESEPPPSASGNVSPPEVIEASPPEAPGPPPSWCETRRHPGYPESEYLLGVGTAHVEIGPDKSQEVAADEAYREAWAAAVTDILSQFETRISSEVTTFIQQSLQITNKDEQTRLLHAGSSRTRATVEGRLKGIRPAERYFNPETGSACVLVVIKRLDYARQVSEELEALTDKAKKAVEEAERLKEEGNPYKAYQVYGEAEALVVACRDLKARIVMAAPNYKLQATLAPPKLGDIYAARKRLASDVHFLLVLRHDAFGRSTLPTSLEESLMAQLKNFGFNVRLATGKLALKSAGELVSDLSLVREAIGKDDRRTLLLACKFTSEGRKIEGDLLSVRTEGWARLLDVVEEELLLTVTTPTGRKNKPAVGLEEQRSELLKKASTAAAANLAEQVYKQF